MSLDTVWLSCNGSDSKQKSSAYFNCLLWVQIVLIKWSAMTVIGTINKLIIVTVMSEMK
jgi:hypothetical protein